MSKLAILGGKPVTKNILEKNQLINCKALEKKYLIDVYESGVWDDYPGIKSMASKFEEEWADFNKSKFCALLTNGTHTLQIALEILDIGAGDEVIVPGITWQATASVVCSVNAVPIIVDVDPETMCIDPERIEEAITSRTRAIIPVHLYHRMADMDRILKIARKYKLHIIEDCAHTHGSQWDGRGAGTLGDFGSFSFQRSKLVNSGEGGALLTQKEKYYWSVVSLRTCGREYNGVKIHGVNCRITCFQAAVLRGQLAAFRKNAPLINRSGLAFDKAVAAAPGVRPLRRNKHITRQCSYCFGFLYDKEMFNNASGAVFRKALSAELGVGFCSTYSPLNHSEVYYPNTKKCHKLSKDYLKAITPARWKLPVAEELFKGKAVLVGWRFFGCPPSRASLLTDAIVKIYENKDELKKVK